MKDCARPVKGHSPPTEGRKVALLGGTGLKTVNHGRVGWSTSLTWLPGCWAFILQAGVWKVLLWGI